MTRYELPPTARDARLRDAFEHVGAAMGEGDRRLIEREARLWARASRSTRRYASEPPTALIRRATEAAGVRTTVFVHTRA
jgi:hypothetical protein